MDGSRFDVLARSVAGATSRRGLLAGLAGLAVGWARGAPAEAACPPDQIQRRGLGCICETTGRPPAAGGVCPCRSGKTRCGAACVDTRRAVAHCGGCGQACPTASPGSCEGQAICRDGSCAVRPAAAGTVCRPAASACDVAEVCDGASLACPADDVQPDGFPCDADGDGCTGGDACQNGLCVPGQPLLCPACQACSGGACQAISTDARCATVCCNGQCCQAGEGCFGGDGACAPEACTGLGQACADETECCQDGVTLCDGVCCHPVGDACTVAGECCTGRCTGESCCGGPRAACTSDGDCCDSRLGACDNGSCRCAAAGDACAIDVECCDGLSCQSGQCRPVTCQPLQAGCVEDADCCQHQPTFCRQSCSDVDLCCHPNGGVCSRDCDCCGGRGSCRGGACCQAESGTCGTSADCCAGLTCSGGVCRLVCPGGSRVCGVGCCPNGQECCNGVCCAAGQDCWNHVCRACLPLQATCDPSNNVCCQHEGTACPATNPYGNQNTCCRPQGGHCGSAADCCREVYDPQWGRDTCGDDGVCGGADAYCGVAADCVDGRSCIGLCMGPGQGFELCKIGGHPCPAGQICSQLRCIDPDDLPPDYGSCVDDADCGGGQICIGLCTGTGQGFDLCAQSSQCPEGLVCRQKRCIHPEELPN